MNYSEALEYIHGASGVFCKPGLERISELCEALGNPERGMKFIHVAGTNGKGSTSAMLSNILIQAGYKVGLYTSPYIYRFNERMQVNGEPIDDDALTNLVIEIAPVVEKMTDKPTEFELITAVAFLYFRREACDVIVLEVGMGGRFDSTNIIRDPLLSVITGIALDHVAFLGDTVEKIAYEKAGIIKDNSPVLFGGEDRAALDVIRNISDERGSRLYTVDHTKIRDTRLSLNGGVFSFGDWKDVRLSLLGTYQFRNAAAVLTAVDILQNQGLKIDTGAVYRGIEATRWRARFEIIHRDPTVIFDGAHNQEGVSVAVESIKSYYPDGRVAIFSGVLRDKDYRAIAKSISEVASVAFTVTPDNPRALPAQEYAEVLRKYGVDATSADSVKEALREGMRYAKEHGVPLCCLGSLYTYSEVARVIEELP